MNEFKQKAMKWALVVLGTAVLLMGAAIWGLTQRPTTDTTSAPPRMLVAGVYTTFAAANAGTDVITDTSHLGPGGYTWREVLDNLFPDPAERQLAEQSGVKIVGNNTTGAWVIYVAKNGTDAHGAPSNGRLVTISLKLPGEYDYWYRHAVPTGDTTCFTVVDATDDGATVADPGLYTTHYVNAPNGCSATFKSDGVSFKPVMKGGGGNPTGTAMPAQPTAAPTTGTSGGGNCDLQSIMNDYQQKRADLDKQLLAAIQACNCGNVVTGTVPMTTTAVPAAPTSAPVAPTSTVETKYGPSGSSVTADQLASWLVDANGKPISKASDWKQEDANTWQLQLPHPVMMYTAQSFDGTAGRFHYGGGLNGEWKDEYFTGPGQHSHNAETPVKDQSVDKIDFQVAGSY